MSAKALTQTLGLKPRVTQSVGERRTTPMGRPLKGFNKETFCVFPIATGQGTKLIAALRRMNEHLHGIKTQLARRRKSGGRYEYYVGIFLTGNGGFIMPPDVAE